MRSYEFKRVYHPKLGRFVYKHKSSGIILDNIFKPIKNIASSVVQKFVKPIGKKAISQAGYKLGKKASEQAGDLIMKRLMAINQRPVTTPKPLRKPVRKPNKNIDTDSANTIINRLISGSGRTSR